METYFKSHFLAIAIIAIIAIGLITFLIRRNQKDEKPFERDASENIKNHDDIL